MGSENGFTSLIWPLGREDPDDAFSSVPYEKVTIKTLTHFIDYIYAYYFTSDRVEFYHFLI